MSYKDLYIQAKKYYYDLQNGDKQYLYLIDKSKYELYESSLNEIVEAIDKANNMKIMQNINYRSKKISEFFERIREAEKLNEKGILLFLQDKKAYKKGVVLYELDSFKPKEGKITVKENQTELNKNYHYFLHFSMENTNKGIKYMLEHGNIKQ